LYLLQGCDQAYTKTAGVCQGVKIDW
jgi:hypothetical protein